MFAASAYSRAGNPVQALQMFANYFKTTCYAMEIQIRAANECYNALQNPQISATITEAQRHELFPLLAERFERANHHELAAQLFRGGGDLVRAGETFIIARGATMLLRTASSQLMPTITGSSVRNCQIELANRNSP